MGIESVWSRKADAIHEALSHPLRRAILVEMAQGREASASKLARSLGTDVQFASYHLKRLAHLGCAELVRKARAEGTGAVEYIYRATGTVAGGDLRGELALDAIADRLAAAEGHPYAELEAIAEILVATGRPVTLTGAG
jgi:DNA-binding transcriptional ArsR family regulator